ncbi:MAG: hypothetical protein DME26_20140, partial [Verrucomicrobia bacterium]
KTTDDELVQWQLSFVTSGTGAGRALFLCDLRSLARRGYSGAPLELSSGVGLFNQLGTILPLPKGEGRGEGKGMMCLSHVSNPFLSSY